MAQKKAAPQANEGGGGRIAAIVFLGVAVVAALSGGVVIFQLVKSYENRIAEMKKPEPTVQAVLAARELFKGHPITEEDIVVIDVPPRFLPGGDPKNIFGTPQNVIGRVPREHILPNEYIRETRLADPETGVGLNAIIPRTWRAISVNVKDGAALSGLLQPGSYVDVVVTITPDEGEKVAETHTLVQAVYVLAVNDQTERSAAAAAAETDPRKKKEKAKNTRRFKPSVTLAVRPHQAEAIAHAEKVGDITLTARRIDEVEFVENLTGTTGDELAGYEKPAPPPVEPPKTPKGPAKAPPPPPPKDEGPTLQITKGTKTTTVSMGGN